ncbi:CPBP family intramembrane glutamic endopeptidase [Rhodanobacter ginsengisoli]|uniref:CPBP family intramembrane glutamic endopeptidase n=1 Tax=Rhodanobacter ginsengisoli TaxID=418646 RepID=A0ABW0QR15_9GAMM
MTILSRRHIERNGELLISTEHFGLALFGSQFLAAAATILFVVWGIGWQTHPNPAVFENWTGTSWHFYVDNFISEIGLGLTVFTIVWLRDATWESLGVRRPNLSIPSILVAVATAYIVLHFLIGPVSLSLWKYCLSFFGINLTQGYGDVDPLQWEVWSLRQAAGQIGVWGAALFVFCVGVLVPVFEELFFRGLILTALLERTSAWGALVSQAFLFAALHIDFIRLPYLIALGLILGYLVKRTSSLVPAVLLHILVNVISLTSVID